MRKNRTRNLTDKEIAKIVALGAVEKVRVAPNTYLQVRYPGKAYWTHVFHMPAITGEPRGNPITQSLGPWEPHHRVADFARRVAARHELVRAGIKPESQRDRRLREIKERDS